MKKIWKKNWKTIVIVAILAIISTSLGAYGTYLLNATQVSYTKSGGTTVSVKEALDELRENRPFEQGQIVSFGGEEFYVLYDSPKSSNTVELFAKTNLNTEATAQVNLPYGQTACAFSSSQYWGNNTGLNLNLEPGYEATDAIGKARQYAKAKGAIDGRLLTKQEVANLTGANLDNWEDWSSMSNTKIKQMINGEKNSQGYEYYWLGSGYEGYAYNVWFVRGGFSFARGSNFLSVNYCGVRPVLNVYKSDVSNAS